MSDALVRIGILVAIFGSVFIVVQLVLNSAWQRGAHRQAVNKRLRMIREGGSREEILAELRKNQPTTHENLPPFIGNRLTALERTVMAAALPVRPGQAIFLMLAAFVLVMALLLFGISSAGFALTAGTLLLALAFGACLAFLLPLIIINSVAERRRKRIEQQFPVALDVFVRALRAGHPIAAAIDLLTHEMEDPIGSEFGLVADEVAYGAELTDALGAMADRWNLDDIRMFVVSLSVQNETGGNLAEILQNLADVIRARASLFMKVRALSSEGRMTGALLTILPVLAFVVLFLINPSFFLDIAQDPMFIIGFGGLIVLYIIGFVTIRKMIDLKV
ncbi:type II secretion system F family protein [Altererythrobacter sp. CAU 1778]